MRTFYAKDRESWRKWLEKNHNKEKEIWLVYYKKAVNKKSVSYGDAVEEALCFGWIDSVMHPNDSESHAQRFSPRNPKSKWSELNKERARRLIAKDLMTPAGSSLLPSDLSDTRLKISDEVLKALKKDPEVWKNFEKFDSLYKRIRIAYIESAKQQKRTEEYNRRLNSFLRATKKNRKIGTIL